MNPESNDANHSNWREDLENSRDLSKREMEYIGFVVNWFESWRLAKNLELCRDVAGRFWKEAVIFKERSSWQLQQWTEGMRWSRITPTHSRDARDLGFELNCVMNF